MNDPFTPEQIAAREASWKASQDGTGLTLTADEAAALWRSIADTGLELCKLRDEVKMYHFNDPTVRTEAVKAALSLVRNTGKTAVRSADGRPSGVACTVAYNHNRPAEDVQSEIDRYCELCTD